MPRVLERIRSAIRNGAYDLTAHAVDEMAEDGQDLTDLELSVMNGKIVTTDKRDPRGTRYTIHGTGADGATLVGTVGRFTGTDRYLIITTYRVSEP